MAKFDIEKLRSRAPFATTYSWSFSVINGFLRPYSDLLDIALISVTMPTKTVNNMDINIRGLRAKVPGMVDSSHSVQLQFLDDTELTVTKVFNELSDKIFNQSTGDQFPKRAIKSDIDIIRMTADWEEVTVIYHLYDAWLESMEPGTLDNQSGIITYSITLCYSELVTEMPE